MRRTFMTIALFRKELQNDSTITTSPAYLTHRSGKLITLR